MKTPPKACIVCGKPISKRTETFYFREPVTYVPPAPRSWGGMHDAIEAKPDGLREGNSAFLAQRPRDRKEAQRFVNGQIISSKRDGDILSSVTFWDGETYQDKFFCTNHCAMQQGYASAQQGTRFAWQRVR